MPYGYDFSHLSVLIVDDHAPTRVILETAFAGLRVGTVKSVRDGSEAMEIIRTGFADVLVTDLKMPGMDGLALTRRVRLGRDSPNPYMPIIMVTGFGSRRKLRAALDAGVDYFMAKPITVRGLYTALRTLIVAPHPYVRAGGYFGPDRRRTKLPYNGPDRRAPVVKPEPERGDVWASQKGVRSRTLA